MRPWCRPGGSKIGSPSTLTASARAAAVRASPIDGQHPAPRLEPLQSAEKTHAEHRLSLTLDHRRLDLLDRELPDADLAQQHGSGARLAIAGLHGVIECE